MDLGMLREGWEEGEGSGRGGGWEGWERLDRKGPEVLEKDIRTVGLDSEGEIIL